MSNNVVDAANTPESVDRGSGEPSSSAWVAVFSLAMGVFGLLTAEYLPASLLTPMAADLGVSEALAGQAVTVTAVVALFAGLLVPRLTRSIDRRLVLLSFTALMILSNALVALSSSMGVLLVMRVLLGIALGGFWSMAAAVAMRLVPAQRVPRALSIDHDAPESTTIAAAMAEQAGIRVAPVVAGTIADEHDVQGLLTPVDGRVAQVMARFPGPIDLALQRPLGRGLQRGQVSEAHHFRLHRATGAAAERGDGQRLGVLADHLGVLTAALPLGEGDRLGPDLVKAQ